MSILESFYILFESNADKVKLAEEEATKAGQKLDLALTASGHGALSLGREIDLAAKQGVFGFTELDKAVHYFNTHLIHQLVDLASKFAGILAIESIADKFFDTVEMVDQLGHVSKELGVNVGDLDAWGKAVQREGGTSEQFQQSLRSLAARLAAIQVGTNSSQGGIKYFQELGVNAADAHGKILPLLDILPRIADAFKGKSAQETAGIGRHLGLDPATILLLQSGRAKVDEMITHEKELGVVTQQNVEAIAKWKDAWLDFTATLQGSALGAFDDILPLLIDFVEGLSDIVNFMEEHESFIVSFFSVIAAIVTTLYFPAMVRAAVVTWELLAPWLAIIAVGVALALVLDDLYNYYEGNNSVIGELTKKYPEFGKVVKDITGFLNSLNIIVNTIMDGFQILGELIVEAFTKGPKQAVADFIKSADTLQDQWNQSITKLKNQFPGLKTAFEDVGKFFENIGARITKVFTNIGNELAKITGYGSETPTPAAGPRPGLVRSPVATPAFHMPADVSAGLGQANAALAAVRSPLLAQTSTSLLTQHQGNTSIAVTVAPTTVNTAGTDPAALANHIEDHLRDKIDKSIQHFTTGVHS